MRTLYALHRFVRTLQLAHAAGQLGLLLLALAVIGLMALYAPAPAAAQARMLSVESLLQPDGTLNPHAGASGAVDLRGWKVKLDPKRGPVLSRANPAPTATETWAALPHNGLKVTENFVPEVAALVVWGSDLYVGGAFNETADGSVTLNNIAKFDGTSWSALPNNGLDSAVSSFALIGNNLYVGGFFSITGDNTVTNLNHVAKFDGTHWSALPHNGLQCCVYTLGAWGGNLYVGGNFAQTNDGGVTNLNCIAKFDGTSWSALPHNGLEFNNCYASSFAVFQNALYVGGGFTKTADNSVTNLNNIAKFDGTSWSALPHNGLNNYVDTIAVFQNALYVGGFFTKTADISVPNLNNIAKFDGSSWSALPHNGVNDEVQTLGVLGNALYLGGIFTKTADNSVTNLNNSAMFDGTNVSALANTGFNDYVNAFALFQNQVYVGGDFTKSSDSSVTLNFIARLPTQVGPNFVVNTDADADDGLCDVLGQGSGNQDCTLREAINAANAQAGANTIQFDADHTITISPALPTLTGDTTIDGGSHSIDLEGGALYRMFDVESAVTLTVNHLYLDEGAANPSLAFGHSGGAIYNNGGTLNVLNSAFSANSASAYGGAIFSNGTTSISNSTFIDNTAGGLGGGVSAASVTVLNTTFSDNTSPTGAGLYAGVSLTLKNTIIANSTGPDCTNAGTLASEKNNLIESTGADACGLVNGTNGDLIGADPALAGFANHGGVTPTEALQDTSLAIEAGDAATCAAAPVSALDQRGVVRPQFTHCDMGSFEFASADCGSQAPALFVLLKPANKKSITQTKVKFDWSDALCGTSYKFTVKNIKTHATVKKTFIKSKGTLTLAAGTYQWFVQACDTAGCTKSKTFKFTN